MTSTLRVIGATVLVALLFTACEPDLERRNRDQLAAVRSSAGLPALVRTDEANRKAWKQADAMASAGTLFHTTDWSSGVAAGWTAMGENVAVAGDIDSAMNALIASPSHYANMVDARFTQVGIGVSRGADGRVYVVQFFIGR